MSYLSSTHPVTTFLGYDFSTAGNFNVFNGTEPELKCKWDTFNTMLLCLLLLTLIMNGFASVVLFRVPLVNVRGRSNPVYLCIRFLNVTDILQTLLLLLMPIFARPDCGWIGGAISCRIMGFMALFLLLASPVFTILMAFDRVIALYQPFKYRSNLGLKMLKIMLPISCGLVLFTTVLPIFGIGEYHVVTGRRFCLLDTITDDPVDRAYVVAIHVIILLALLFMAACTVTFQIKLCCMSFEKKHRELQSKSAARKNASRRRTRNATITTMAVCGIFILCYLPYVSRVLSESSSGNKSSSWVIWITFGLAFTQPLLNPIVYVATNVRYRQEMQNLLRRKKTREVESTDSNTATSRGAINGFRRRWSNSVSGSRKSSARSSIQKHKEYHSKKGHFSPRSLPGKKDKDYSKNSDVFDDRAIANVMRRAPSSSSGTRSIDSHERLTLHQNHRKSELLSHHTFGRLGRTSEEDVDQLDSGNRERCHTVSGDVSPAASIATKIRELRASQCSNSVPLLNNDKVGIDDAANEELIVAYDESPKLNRRALENSGNDRSSMKNVSITTLTDIKALDNGVILSNGIHNQATNHTDDDKNVVTNNKSRRSNDLRKPSHRDSGMIDISDHST
ncbi:uncharacterized protein LOC143469255 isoform X2 [Clavelina lepadiformis]|uniref:uncharacterized protein LOC143469255 isoform X2 n=1 Tax=Clavelina lepadiformis TaxID=159417 RepID=UPI0040417FA4